MAIDTATPRAMQPRAQASMHRPHVAVRQHTNGNVARRRKKRADDDTAVTIVAVGPEHRERIAARSADEIGD